MLFLHPQDDGISLDKVVVDMIVFAALTCTFWPCANNQVSNAYAGKQEKGTLAGLPTVSLVNVAGRRPSE